MKLVALEAGLLPSHTLQSFSHSYLLVVFFFFLQNEKYSLRGSDLPSLSDTSIRLRLASSQYGAIVEAFLFML